VSSVGLVTRKLFDFLLKGSVLSVKNNTVLRNDLLVDFETWEGVRTIGNFCISSGFLLFLLLVLGLSVFIFF